MRYQAELDVLNRLLAATRSGEIAWEEGEEYYTTTIGGREVSFRFMYYEATNQIGADPRMIELHMPGLNGGYFCGTEGFSILLEILGTAFEKWRSKLAPNAALKFLDEALTSRLVSEQTDEPH